jgi:hypothetical protein
MSAFTAWQSQDRSSRDVRRTRLRLPPEAPRQRLVSMLEEALRLAELPGEAEGRCYYFRRVHVAGLPVDGNRAVWLDRFQRMLNEQAASAVYAGAPAAAASDAVYFASYREACEILLRRIVTRRGAPEWFWRSVLTPDAAAARWASMASPGRADLPVIVEQLRHMPASWVAVAESVFAALGDESPVYLLQSFPVSMVEAWVQEIGGWRPAPVLVAEAPLPARTRAAVVSAMTSLGPADPRTEWLATLAVLLDRPQDLQSKTAVARARATLRVMAAQDTPAQWSAPQPVQQICGDEVPSIEPAVTTLHSRDTVLVATPPQGAAPIAQPHPAPVEVRPEQPRPLSAQIASEPEIRKSPAPRIPLKGLPLDLGTPTAAGGLFFFLNVLGRMGIADAMQDGLAIRVLLRLAEAAGIEPEDSVVAWLEDEAGPPALPRYRRDAVREAKVARAWSLAARRWCWRNGRLTVRDIVRRQAIWSVNRTDLDVTLPLDSADVATRRLGLDLDPGWLPWFGRVVRFHYRDRGGAHV